MACYSERKAETQQGEREKETQWPSFWKGFVFARFRGARLFCLQKTERPFLVTIKAFASYSSPLPPSLKRRPTRKQFFLLFSSLLFCLSFNLKHLSSLVIKKDSRWLIFFWNSTELTCCNGFISNTCEAKAENWECVMNGAWKQTQMAKQHRISTLYEAVPCLIVIVIESGVELSIGLAVVYEKHVK